MVIKMSTSCEMCEGTPRPAVYRVAAESGPELTEDPQIVSCRVCVHAAVRAVRKIEFVIGPAYIDPI